MGNAVSNPEIKLTPEMEKIQNLLDTNTETFTGQKGSANFGFGQNLGENMSQADILAQLQVALGHPQGRQMTLEEEMAEARRRGFAPPPAPENRMGALAAARAALPEVRVALGHRPDAQFREVVGLPARAGPGEEMAELRRLPINALLTAPENRPPGIAALFAQTEEQRVAAARARRAAAAAAEDDGGGGGGARQADRARIAALERELMQARAAPAAAAAAAPGDGGNRYRVAAQAPPPPPRIDDDNLFEVPGDQVRLRHPGAAAIGRYNVNDEVIVDGIIIKLSNQEAYLVEQAVARVKRIIGPPGEVPFYYIRLNNLRDANAMGPVGAAPARIVRAEPARGAPAGARAEPARGARAEPARGARAEPARGAPAGARAEPARGAPAGARAEPARGARAEPAPRPFVPRFNVDQPIFVSGSISAREVVLRKPGVIMNVIPNEVLRQFFYTVRFDDTIRRVAEELIEARPEQPRGADAAPRGADAAPRGAAGAAPRGAAGAAVELPPCGICLGDKDVTIRDGDNRVNVLGGCGHTFHRHCLTEMIAGVEAQRAENPWGAMGLLCPECRVPFTADTVLTLHLGGSLSRAPSWPTRPLPGEDYSELVFSDQGSVAVPVQREFPPSLPPESPPLTHEQIIAGYEREIIDNKNIININTNALNNIKQIEETHQGNDQGSIPEKYRLLAQIQENMGNQIAADRYHNVSRTIANNPFNTPQMREFIDINESDLRLAKARIQQKINDAHANISRLLDYINSY